MPTTYPFKNSIQKIFTAAKNWRRDKPRPPWSRKRKIVTTSVLLFLAHLVGALTSLHAVMSDRSSQGAIAWVVSLNTFPYVAVPAYWVLGKSEYDGYVKAYRSALEDPEKKLAEVYEYVRKNEVGSNDDEERSLVEKLKGLPYTTGNKLELLIDGRATFKAMTEAIESAKSYVLFQFYIIRDDELGQHFKDLLIKKASQGVKIYFLFDRLGSRKLSNAYQQQLIEAGVEVASFGHLDKGTGIFQINFRNHRKVVVIDGQKALVGGLNIGNEYLGLSEEFGDWRDTHIAISGPAAMEAQLSFLEDWKWASGEWLDLNWKTAANPEGDAVAITIATGPADKFETAEMLILQAINSAKKRVWISTPYYVPNSAIVAALELAALKGVDVRILLPDKTDNKLVSFAANTYFEQSMRTGVRFFKYSNGFMHSKTILVDDNYSIVTSANLDNRSLRLNFEIFALLRDQEFNRKMEQMYLNDFAASHELPKDVFSSMPIWYRLASRLARLTSPVL
ncbi:cardiolipin synthase [Arsukibacterium sp. MJ3]|uniref:cardiolipin synthase n=1 Tax=Arsukibacterium sp. MJ3 TaxID=1632859 RepID=UPI000AEE255D|nr:cardiolipin synthase [Arsukibacterium sp. MJ3]